MNSDPSWRAGQTVAARTPRASRIVGNRARSTPAMSGRYSQIRSRFTGLRCSGTIRPRTNKTISAGTSVTDRSAAAAMAKVLVRARGPNSRPSSPSRVKIGRKLTVMMRSEKNSDGPTSLAASITSVRQGAACEPERS